jgi:hypothetical protein
MDHFFSAILILKIVFLKPSAGWLSKNNLGLSTDCGAEKPLIVSHNENCYFLLEIS